MLLAAPLLQGCVVSAVAGAAVAVAKAPFQVAGAAVDSVTTSQEEADRNRGRELREQEEKAEKARKKEEKARKKAEREARERDDD